MKCSCKGGKNRAISLLIIYKNHFYNQVEYFHLHVIFFLHYRYKNSIVNPSKKLVVNQHQGGQYDQEERCSLSLFIQNRIFTDKLYPVDTWLDKAGSRLSLFNGSMQRDRPRKTGKDTKRQLLKKYCLICQSTDLTWSLNWRHCYDFF